MKRIAVNVPHPRPREWNIVVKRHGVPPAKVINSILSTVILPMDWTIYSSKKFLHTWIVTDEKQKPIAMVYYIKDKLGFTKFYPSLCSAK